MTTMNDEVLKTDEEPVTQPELELDADESSGANVELEDSAATASATAPNGELGELVQPQEIVREHGPQPIAELMAALQLKPHDLVAASTEQLTHKMVARAVKGRRLTNNTKGIVQRALNKATGNSYKLAQLFNY
jgi:hypothetical protein